MPIYIYIYTCFHLQMADNEYQYIYIYIFIYRLRIISTNIYVYIYMYIHVCTGIVYIVFIAGFATILMLYIIQEVSNPGSHVDSRESNGVNRGLMMCVIFRQTRWDIVRRGWSMTPAHKTNLNINHHDPWHTGISAYIMTLKKQFGLRNLPVGDWGEDRQIPIAVGRVPMTPLIPTVTSLEWCFLGTSSSNDGFSTILLNLSQVG